MGTSDERGGVKAREDLIRAVLRRVSSERDDPNAYFDAELEYCDDMIQIACPLIWTRREPRARQSLRPHFTRRARNERS